MENMNSNQKSKSWIWLVAIILITVGTASMIYYGKMNNNFKNSAAPKPFYPALGFDPISKDSIYEKIVAFNALNADSTLVSTLEMDGKITVVETFFASCQSICPIMNHQLTRVFNDLSQNENFQIFSYTVDPTRDNLSVLRRYAEEHEAKLSQWRFLHSPQDSIFNFGRWSLRLPVGEEEIEGNFLHSERFVLVDWNRVIRGYYDGTDSLSVNKMMNHIVLLMSEKERIERKKGRK
jgi:protein SCO1